jgi:hypothetical protein
MSSRGDEAMESMRKRFGACLMAILVATILIGPLECLRGQDKRTPELRPLNSNPITVRIIEQTPRTLYETVAKFADINILWDRETKAQSETGRFTVEVSKATLREALDKVASVTKTSWKPISGTTIFVESR